MVGLAVGAWSREIGDWERDAGTPTFAELDESYHGIIYTKDYAVAPFVIKAHMQLQRDFGAYPAAHSAFMLNQSLESLDVRMRRHCENALKVAEYLESRTDLLNDVRYPA